MRRAEGKAASYLEAPERPLDGERLLVLDGDPLGAAMGWWPGDAAE